MQPTSKSENLIKVNQLITYYLPVCDLLRIQQYPVNTTYNKQAAQHLFAVQNMQQVSI